jgi:hypothetical protein
MGALARAPISPGFIGRKHDPHQNRPTREPDITICNYEDYQLKPSASDPLATHSRPKLNTEAAAAAAPAPAGVCSIAIETAEGVAGDGVSRQPQHPTRLVRAPQLA